MEEEARMEETRGRAKAKKCVRGGNTIQPGEIFEAVEGDIPDSCRRARIILGPLLVSLVALKKTAPLIGIKSAVRLYASRRRDAEKAPDVLLASFLQLAAGALGYYLFFST